MPGNVSAAGVAAVNGIIYVIGGGNGTIALSTNYAYNPQTNTWTQLAPMPTARVELSVAAVNGKIYAIGGYNGTTAINTVEEYDPITNIWATRAPMPTSRSLTSCAVVGNKIYVVGGWFPDLTTLEEYNPLTNVWTSRAPLPNPGRQQINSAFASNNKLHVIGGKDRFNTITYNFNSVYDPVTNSWISNAVLPQSIFAGAVASSNGFFHYLGGTNHATNLSNSAGFNTNYIYNPISDCIFRTQLTPHSGVN
jgi:N-acetylneuraminic acid mutarotase